MRQRDRGGGAGPSQMSFTGSYLENHRQVGYLTKPPLLTLKKHANINKPGKRLQKRGQDICSTCQVTLVETSIAMCEMFTSYTVAYYKKAHHRNKRVFS